METFPFPKDILFIFRSDLPVISESLSLKNTAHKSDIMLLHSVSSDMIIAESKNTSSQHTPKYERKCFFLFFLCNPSTDFLHQVCQSQTPCMRLQLIRSWIAHIAERWAFTSLSSVSQPQMHFLPTWSPFPKLQYIKNNSVNILWWVFPGFTVFWHGTKIYSPSPNL